MGAAQLRIALLDPRDKLKSVHDATRDEE